MSFDCTMDVGYYGVAGGTVAHHTYAFCVKDGVRYCLPCFGGYAEHEGDWEAARVVYPAELWSPWIIGSKPQGKALPANLRVALGMAQFNANPAFNWSRAEWDASLKSNPVAGLAHHSGLLYAVAGVCHQACNRVLWATRDHAFDHTPVNWPPSFTATYWVYGWWGAAAGVAMLLARGLWDQAKAQPQDFGELAICEGPPDAGAPQPAFDMGPPPEALVPDLDAQLGKALGEFLSEGHAAPARTQSVHAMLDASAAGEPALMSADMGNERGKAVDLDVAFQAKKHALDMALLAGQIDSQKYAAEINAAFDGLLVELRDALPDAQFEKLFGGELAARGADAQLVNPGMMPETAAYQETAQRLGIR